MTAIASRPSKDNAPRDQKSPATLNSEEKLKALDELFQEVGRYRKSDDYKALLQFIRKMPWVGPYNAFLLHIQKPGISFVATASEWRVKYKRHIKPNARPLVILWPFAPVRFVFDLADTDGEEPVPDHILHPFRTRGKLSIKKFDRLIKNLPSDGVSFSEGDYGPDKAGHIQIANPEGIQQVGNQRAKVLFHLVVNQNHTKQEQFPTIAHELAHLYCGHFGSPNPYWWDDRRGRSQNVEEFEAESAAWLVCERLGIENPSAEYLSGYLDSGKDIPSISLEHVLKAAGRIESLTSRSYPLRKGVIVK